MRRLERFDTTLGDLIVALTDEAGRYVIDDREKYRVVAIMLTGVLKNSPSRSSVRPALLSAQVLN